MQRTPETSSTAAAAEVGRPGRRPPIGATVLGYPRIGPRRELKRALERHWRGRIDEAALGAVGSGLRRAAWSRLSPLGADAVPSNTFSYYDQMLDTAVMVGAVPDRFRGRRTPLATYFAMARGDDDAEPLEMTKWFDTNYHYLVPEISAGQEFSLDPAKALGEFTEALEQGVRTRPVIIGPATFLLLAKAAEGAACGFRPFDRLDDLLGLYEVLLTRLAAAGAQWVQFDEPAFAADRSDEEIAALGTAYTRLAAVHHRPAILVATYFGGIGPALPVLAGTPVEAIGVDCVAGSAAEVRAVPQLRDKTLVAGVVDGRNVWRTDLDAALATIESLRDVAAAVVPSTSCSLLHVPYDLDVEEALDPAVRRWLAFAEQKVEEVRLLGRAATDQLSASAESPVGARDAVAAGNDDGRAAMVAQLASARAALAERPAAPGVRVDAVRSRTAAAGQAEVTRTAYDVRAKAQADRLGLPTLPTTTIGSFPQTDALRVARAELRRGEIEEAQYDAAMRAEVERVVRMQEALGLDVLVHGEPERNDMVQYFAEDLAGFASTELGWVQSYGSRCVRPPILWGDVHRPAPMTVEWATYAASLTDRPMKGMLTGPVTIIAWSFVRDDLPLGEVAAQIGLAIRDEVRDLEAAGIPIVQVDEPALRELLPLRKADQAAYLDWSVRAFRLATAGAADATQIHTHLCYSEFGEVIDAIDGLDADVTSIEAARSRMEVLGDLHARGFERGIGPGVYDIHSPRVPPVQAIRSLLAAAVESVPADRLWVNPDCGLKTRGYAEVEAALANLVTAARETRAAL